MRVWVWVALGLASLPFAAQQPATSRPILENTLQVRAEGKFEAEPDTAVITLTLSDREARQDDAYREVSNAAQQLRQVLQQNSVDPKQAKVSSYTISPEYDWKNPKNRKPVAYSVQTTATLKVTDFALANKLLQALSELNHASNQSLDYTLENVLAAKKKAIADAYGTAREYADAVVGASGRHLGDLLYASVDTQEQVFPRPLMYSRSTAEVSAQAAPPPPTQDMGQQNITVTAQVTAVFRLQ